MQQLRYIYCKMAIMTTYGHRSVGTDDPVRSRVLNHGIAGLVLTWVTSRESPVLYVFVLLLQDAVFLGMGEGEWVRGSGEGMGALEFLK